MSQSEQTAVPSVLQNNCDWAPGAWGVGDQRLEGDCCACKVPTLGAARLRATSPENEVPLFDAAEVGCAPVCVCVCNR